MSGPLVFGWLCMSGGLWLVVRAFRSRARRRALLRNCVRVIGRVVRLDDTTTEGDVAATSAPVVRYSAQDGKAHEIALPPRHDTDSVRVGTSVPVFYERGNPKNAVHVKRMWDVNLACALSFIPVVIGAGIIYTVYQDK